MKITKYFFILASLVIVVLSSCTETMNPINSNNGNITADTTWDSDITISGEIKVQSGATLTIAPGVTVKADTSANTVLLILPGGKIMAEGTSESPIIFTSSRSLGNRGQQDWGGIQILGYATIPGETATAEGTDESYGGNNDSDNSGVLRYVRIEFAGKDTGENELNGLGLFGVGSGTIIKNVHLHNCKDDGVEPFGGTVNLVNIISTANGDDQIDCAAGWRGYLSNAITVNINGGSSIEFDGNSGNNINSIVNVHNLTVINNGDGDGYATLWRRAGVYSVYDSLFIGNSTNTSTGLVEVDTAGVYSNFGSNRYITAASSYLVLETNTVSYVTNNGVTVNLNITNGYPYGITVPNSVTSLTALFNALDNNKYGWAKWSAFPAN